VPDSRPNIILIISEQHRGDCLSIDGHPVLLTPNLDAIAGGGVRFTRAYTTCPTCIAARRSILSGQYPPTHGMVGYRDWVEWDAPTTLPQALRDAGYQTVHVGRDMHQTPRRKRFGFDHMVIGDDWKEWFVREAPDAGGWRGSGIMNNDYTAYPWPHADSLHPTNWTVERALEFLRRRDPCCPFFLNVSFIAAHPPLQPPAFYFERYVRTGVPDPHIGDWAVPPDNRGLGLDVGTLRAQLEGERLLSARAGYYGLINHLDDQIRRLLYPPESGIDLDNTIVMFVSDHGEMLGDHYMWHKLRPYEPSARIPMLLRAPGRFGIRPGTVADQLVSLEDVMPTLLELAEIPVPETVEGRSLLPALRGDPNPLHERLHIEHAPMHHTLFDGREKYVWFVRDGAEQLFDVVDDPHELHELRADRPERLAHWRARMIEELKDRPEGFSDGMKLCPGRPYDPVLPHARPRP
jgi:arylsulfatase A-like enzyme